MADPYLLPCACGRKTAVEPSQAGQNIECACGARVEVPTLGQLRQLERAEPPRDERDREKPAWTNSHRVAVVGWLVLAFALAWAVALVRGRPVPPRDQIDLAAARAFFESRLADTAPAKTLDAWDFFRKAGLNQIPESAEKAYRDAAIRFRFSVGGCTLLTILGLGLIGAASYAGRRLNAD